MKRLSVRVFSSILLFLLVFFSTGWLTLGLGSENPVPSWLQNFWGTLITVGLALEQGIGFVPDETQARAHAALVVTSASVAWAILLTILVLPVVALKRALSAQRV